MQVVSFVDSENTVWYVNTDNMTVIESEEGTRLRFELLPEEIDEDYPEPNTADLLFDQNEKISADFLRSLPLINSFPVHEYGKWNHWAYTCDGEIGMYF